MALRQNVMAEELKNNMKIVEFTKFTKLYSNMAEKECQFIRHHLKGSTVEILRDDELLTCPVEQLQTGDSLRKIFDIPSSARRVTTVTKGFVKQLIQRGFRSFTVQTQEKAASSKQQKHQASVQEANAFIQKIRESIKIREQATEAAQSMIDNARKGKPSAKEVENNIDLILSDSSPEALAAIASLQSSDQTYAHCIDAAAIFQTAYFAIKKKKKETSIFSGEKLAMFGAFTHDLGKAKVPKSILESTERFDRESEEMRQIQSHPVYGAELLNNMNMPKSIMNMAHYHHVKMDTLLNSSYPANVSYADVIMETRLVSIVDVYQALIGKRSYKKSWGPPEAIRYLDTLTGSEFDPDVWDDFVSVIGIYPKSSLVEMSDGTIGFVMSVPEDDLERPEVVIFRDADGNDFEQPVLVDLSEEPDLEIEQDLDHYEVLGENAIDIFIGLEVR
ncbi:MAG: HD domain-containing protein [SAR324 cluster bacterium]|nr:HD domain-containing protein [SAR324 cluster bacterium]